MTNRKLPSDHVRLPPPSQARRAASLNETAVDIHEYVEQAGSKQETVLYLGYGSNLCNETFRGKRGIKPLAQINVQVPSLRVTFDLPGIPYVEPCFANSGLRDPEHDPPKPSGFNGMTGEKGLPVGRRGYRKDEWHKGLIGVVYEVTAQDFAHIIATEGGGTSYQDIVVDCHPFATSDPADPVPDKPTLPPFKAHTLFAPAVPPNKPPPKEGGRFRRPDPSYAQASARYLKLMSDGAAELGLPHEYQDHLHSLRPYTITTLRQRMGKALFLAIWVPIVFSVFGLGKIFADKKGRLPGWLRQLTGAVFKAAWGSYDNVFKRSFGDGERTITDQDDASDREKQMPWTTGGSRIEQFPSAELEKSPKSRKAQRTRVPSTSILPGFRPSTSALQLHFHMYIYQRPSHVPTWTMMARPQASFETEKVINVSQDAISSPSSDPDKVQIENTVEVVEDSFKAFYRGGPVQQPQHTQSDDYDELYSVSPGAKRSSDKHRISAERTATQEQTIPANSTLQHPNRTVELQHHDAAAESLDTVDVLLARGATVHTAANGTQVQSRGKLNDQRGERADYYQSPRHQLDQQPPHAPGNLQIADESLSAADGSGTKSSRKSTNAVLPNHGNANSTFAGHDTESSSKRPVCGPGSSLTALLARRHDQSHSGPPITWPTAPGPPKPATDISQASKDERSKSKPLSKEAQLPARHGQNHSRKQDPSIMGKLQTSRGDRAVQRPTPEPRPPSQAERQPSAGKLRSVKRGTRIPMPAPASTPFKQPALRSKASDDRKADHDDITVKKRVAKSAVAVDPVDKGSLKRPARIGDPSTVKRNATYDVPDSPEEEETQRPAKKARSAAVGAKAKVASTPSTRKGKPGTKATASTSGAGSKQTHAAATQVGRGTARMRTMAQSEAANTNNTRRRSAVSGSATSSIEPSKGKTNSALNDPRVNESLHDFEESVIDYGEERREQHRRRPDVQGAPLKNKDTADESIIKSEKQTERPDALTKPVPSQASAAQTTTGSSQEEPIILSDRPESSSPAPSTPLQEGGVSAAEAAFYPQEAIVRVPKTPTVLPSSPPVLTQEAGEVVATPTGLVDDVAARRSNIISFSKSGPRNQGGVSARKGTLRSPGKNRSSVPPTASSKASGIIDRVKLEMKQKTGPSSGASSLRSVKSTRSVAPSNVAEDASEALAGFMKKASRNHDADQGVNSALTATANDALIAIKSRAAPYEAVFVNIEDFEGTTFVHDETMPLAEDDMEPASEIRALQRPMPPPVPKLSKSQKLHRAPTVPSMVTGEILSSGEQPEHRVSTKTAIKRKSHVSSPDPIATKRPRTDTTIQTDKVKPPQATTQKSVVSLPSTKVKMFEQFTEHIQKPTVHESRKPSRVGSHGSQRVDRDGSPIPDGMVVPEMSTALETFSQQAILSSDPVAVRRRTQQKTVFNVKIGQPHQQDEFIPTSHQPSRLSSNSKPRPAPPHEASRAITGFAKVDFNAAFEQDMNYSPFNESFHASERAPKQAPPTSSFSSFKDQLNRMTVEAHAKSITPAGPAPDADPDKTLVEPERMFRTFARKPSLASSASSDTSEDTEDSSVSRRDLRIWRNALQPHQINLFDELVTVSHRLVQHLVERETAATDVVDDYRRRGLNLVETMELSHAEQRGSYVRSLKDRKKRLCKDLYDCGGKLKEISANVKNAKSDQFNHGGDDENVEDTLQKVMVDFC